MDISNPFQKHERATKLTWYAAVWLIVVAFCVSAEEQISVLSGQSLVYETAIDMPGHTQSFTLLELPSGEILVGVIGGVLHYDGERWQSIPIKAEQAVRALHWLKDKVYVGSYDEFGFLERDPKGNWHYDSLSSLIQAETDGSGFADIWQITSTHEGVYFRALKHLFLFGFDNQNIQQWYYPDKFGAILSHEGRLYLQFRSQGLKQKQGSDFVMLAGGEVLKEPINKIWPLSDGFLLQNRFGPWQKLQKEALEKVDVVDSFPDPGAFSASLLVKPDNLVLADKDGWLWNWDITKGTFSKTWISSRNVWSLASISNQTYLALSDHRIFHLESPARWSRVAFESGIKGSFYGFQYALGDWYALTSSGVFRSHRSWTGGPAYPAFKSLDWTQNEAWRLIEWQEASLILTSSYHLLWIQADQTIQKLNDALLYPRTLLASQCENLLYVGSEYGLTIFKFDSEKGFTQVDQFILDKKVNSFAEKECGELWMGLDHLGVVLLDVSPQSGLIKNSKRYSSELGIEPGQQISTSVSIVDQQLIASNVHDVFEWQNTEFVGQGLAHLKDRFSKEASISVNQAENGEVWAFSSESLWIRDSNWVWHQESLSGLAFGHIMDVTFGPGDQVFLVTDSAVYKVNRNQIETTLSAKPLVISSVRLLGSEPKRLSTRPNTPIALNANENTLRFDFALADLGLRKGRLYQSKLEGLEQDWDAWQANPSVTYFDLYPGEYSLKIRAKDAQGHVSHAREYVFVIQPRWYASTWGRILLTLLVLSGLFFLIRLIFKWRLKRIVFEKNRLRSMVNERTEELEKLNIRLDYMAHYDQLTGIANRRKIDQYFEQSKLQCAQSKEPMSLCVMDLDHFKQYNDQYGHHEGDQVLKTVGQILQTQEERSKIKAGRFGGEEFVLILPGYDLNSGALLAESVRKQIELAKMNITASIGIVALEPVSDQGFDQAFQAADEALYQAKSKGRNQVVCANAPG